ncbi:predicted protein [Chaetoceros tenuissimus]|uniref:Uncharacterized protein n=1 Tax=Chaetoceros tenuissimus TaxID=426638 RepID=A0AAD3D602_9STRA|nr:predicted protein [Chaetoceros tenuissimus]
MKADSKIQLTSPPIYVERKASMKRRLFDESLSSLSYDTSPEVKSSPQPKRQMKGEFEKYESNEKKGPNASDLFDQDDDDDSDCWVHRSFILQRAKEGVSEAQAIKEWFANTDKCEEKEVEFKPDQKE